MIVGRCHCGACRLELDWPTAAPLPARRCGCSFCTSHGGVWTSHPDARLRIHPSDRWHRYRFGTETADFLLCANCGVPLAALSVIDNRTYAVVNVNTLDGELHLEDPIDTDFDGESTTGRLARRAARWISDVSGP